MKAEALFDELAAIEDEKQLALYIEKIQKAYNKEFKTFLREMMDRMGVDRAWLYRHSRMERTYIYQLLDGKKTHPGKDKVVMMGIALRMNVDEICYALELADTGILNPKTSRDSLLIYALQRKYSIAATNALLEQFGEKLLE